MPHIKAPQTFDDVEEIEKRVYYVLTQEPKSLTGHRTAKAVGILFQRLHSKGVLKKKDLDAILLECTN